MKGFKNNSFANRISVNGALNTQKSIPKPMLSLNASFKEQQFQVFIFIQYWID